VRSDPFYYYVNARTKYYDQVFLDAIQDSFSRIVNVGCGSDTRAHRFAPLLKGKGVSVFECDQEGAIAVKERIALKKWPSDPIKYISIDLDDGNWETFTRNLETNGSGHPVLVMMEGVSPYVGRDAFRSFLQMLAAKLPRGSRVAYDFKVRGVKDDFGRAAGAGQRFRLPADKAEVAAYHRELGYELRHMELGSELFRRLLPGLGTPFEEDCLVQFTTGSLAA
jgi:methyltransferase (TIGR00027 family)